MLVRNGGLVRLVVVVGRHWPLSSGLGRPRDGPGSPRSTNGRHPRCAPSEPQPTTVSHDGERADRPRTRMPRCTPAGLSRVAMAVDQSKSRRSVPDDGGQPSPQLGKLGSSGGVAALTCGGRCWSSHRARGECPAFPVVPRRIWHVNGTAHQYGMRLKSVARNGAVAANWVERIGRGQR